MAAGGTDMELFLGGLAFVGLAAAVFFAARWKGAQASLAGLEQAGQAQNQAQQAEIARLTSIAGERGTKAEIAEANQKNADARAIELRAERDATLRQRDELARELSELNARHAKLGESLVQERRQAEEKLALLNAARQEMKLEFQALSQEIMKGHSQAFAEQNKEQMNNLLTPLRTRLEEFQKSLHAAHTESNRERITLAEQIKGLTQTSTQMMTETTNLTRALKGETQTQGAWGEMILESILERSGLRAGEEYVTQTSHTIDGGRVRTDVIVNLPNGQRVVIDSKVSLTAFESYCNCAEDAERALHLKGHLTSLRAHIKILSGKDYHAAAGSNLDYVIMFVPIEGALAAALQHDTALTGYAIESNVQIATPTTLMIALRTIANVWNVERRNRNAEEIAKRAGSLYEKFVGFAGDMQALGGRIDQAKSSYDEAMSKLSSGRGNIVRQVEQLKDMGAKTNKVIPTALLNEADDDLPLLPSANRDAAE
jgi:DNA recombination protein RmuC